MDVSKLLKMLDDDEGPKLDFKMYLELSSESSKKELTKDVIAIANSYGGRGHLVLGIEDKTKHVVGVILKDYSEEKIQQIILNRCDPPIPIRVEFFEVEQKDIAVITIFKSHNRPHQMRQNGAFYIRRGSTTDYARRDEVAGMLQKSGLMYDELVPVYRGRLEHLDMSSINAFVEKTTGEIYKKGAESLLSDVGILYYDKEDNHFYPTIGGVLLFGKKPQQLLPHTGMSIIYNDNANERRIHRIEGTIIMMLNAAMRFIKNKIKVMDYPFSAIEEALSNALVHRDYFDQSREIIVSLGQNSVELLNPGPIYDEDPVNNVIKSPAPKRRNNWMYHQLIILDNKKRFSRYGRGLQKIKQTVAPYGKVKFVNMKKRNLFKVILPGIGMCQEKRSSK